MRQLAGLSHFKTLFFCLLILKPMSVFGQANVNSLPSAGKASGYASYTPAAIPIGGPQGDAALAQQERMALMQAFMTFLGSMFGNKNNSNPELASGGGDFGGGGASGGWSGPPVGAYELSGGQSIVEPFQRNFDRCSQELGLGSCKFENLGIMGDASHRARRSCHNAGEAIDVGPLTCSGTQAIPSNHPKFFAMAKCLANNSNNELQVIFYRAEGPNMIQKSDHVGHMHVQIKNCRMIYGQ